MKKKWMANGISVVKFVVFGVLALGSATQSATARTVGPGATLWVNGVPETLSGMSEARACSHYPKLPEKGQYWAFSICFRRRFRPDVITFRLSIYQKL